VRFFAYNGTGDNRLPNSLGAGCHGSRCETRRATRKTSAYRYGGISCLLATGVGGVRRVGLGSRLAFVTVAVDLGRPY